MSKELDIYNSVYDTIDKISENKDIQMFLNKSENIINKYIKIFPNLTYHQIISLYITYSLIIYADI